MKGFGYALRRFALRVLGFFPLLLPVGAKEWDMYCQWVLFAYGYPDYPSYRHALASMIMHLDQTTIRVRPRNLAIQLKNGQMKQTAYQVIQDQRNEEKKRADAAIKAADKVKADASATTDSKPQEAASNVAGSIS